MVMSPDNTKWYERNPILFIMWSYQHWVKGIRRDMGKFPVKPEHIKEIERWNEEIRNTNSWPWNENCSFCILLRMGNDFGYCPRCYWQRSQGHDTIRIMKRIIKNGDEQDAYTRWRYLLCYTSRAGVVKAIKRRTHKRERREAKHWIEEQLDE